MVSSGGCTVHRIFEHQYKHTWDRFSMSQHQKYQMLQLFTFPHYANQRALCAIVIHLFVIYVYIIYINKVCIMYKQENQHSELGDEVLYPICVQNTACNTCLSSWGIHK